ASVVDQGCDACVPVQGAEDTETQGNWKNVYGSEGGMIPLEAGNVVPPWATFSTTNAATYNWGDTSTDTRALLRRNSSTTRIPSTFYNTDFSVDVGITDGAPHDVSLYFMDYSG